MFLCITEANGRDVYINPKHVISVFRGADNGVNVKVSDGKVYVDTGNSLAAIVTKLEAACFSQV